MDHRITLKHVLTSTCGTLVFCCLFLSIQEPPAYKKPRAYRIKEPTERNILTRNISDNITRNIIKLNIQSNNSQIRYFSTSLVDGRDSRIIDLDKSVPTVDEMYDRLVLITAFSDNHYNEAMGYIGTAQRFMPGKKIIVYDLGLKAAYKNKIRELCHVELRAFHFHHYPEHVSNLMTYAWKPIIIDLALKEFGAIYYGDSSIRFRKSLKVLLPGIERHHGYVVNILGFDPKKHQIPIHHYALTVPEMFVKLDVDREEYFNCNNSAPHIQPGSQLIVNSTTIQIKLLQPWLQCALEKDCIAPKGSSRQNHRQDASAITLLVYKNLFGEWTEEDNDTKKMQSVLYVKRGTNTFRENPKYC